MFRLIAVLTLTLGTNAFSNDGPEKPCTKSEAMQAEKEVDSLKNWNDIYRSYRKFSQCDDGAIAEGFSDAVGRLLSNNWDQLGRLITLAKTDKNFERFVVRHIDESLSRDTLQRISNNARSSCPAGGQRLCVLIASAAADKT
jgi:hypothetical protein